MKKYLVVTLAAIVLVGACAGMDTTTQRTLTGGAVGAGSGALIGAGVGSAASGAAIGGGAGLLGGYLYDQYEKSQGR